jgi:hypothetical protein
MVIILDVIIVNAKGIHILLEISEEDINCTPTSLHLVDMFTSDSYATDLVPS